MNRQGIEKIEQIERIFPEYVEKICGVNGSNEKVINFMALKKLLSDDGLYGDEAYRFRWIRGGSDKQVKTNLFSCTGENSNWETTGKIYIDRNNLEELKVLNKDLLGKAKMIYIDPPYNTGRGDFIYCDKDKEQHHSLWCSMIYPKLMLSLHLLQQGGSLWISIDGNEIGNVLKFGDEIFGGSNRLICIADTDSSEGCIDRRKIAATLHEHIVVYQKQNNEI